MVITVLAIDPSSTNTGWCFFDGAESLCWSTQYKQALYADKFGAFMVDLNTAIASHDPVTVAYEDPPVLRSHQANKILMGMAALIQAAAHVAGKPSLPVNTATIKAHSGASAGQRFMKRAMTSREKTAARAERKAVSISAALMMGFKVANDDEADAAILADYVARSAVFGETLANACRPKRGKVAA